MELAELIARYPSSVTLSDGSAVELCLMAADDRERLLAFARSLPDDDKMFLRHDITAPETIDSWVDNIAAGLNITLLAVRDGNVMGYASVDRDPVPWTRRVGEIRINIDRTLRALGLGRSMISQIFDIARATGLKKLVANMSDDQIGARTALRRVGFVPEALLADHVEDRAGRLHDLVVMSYDVDGLSDQLAEPVRM